MNVLNLSAQSRALLLAAVTLLAAGAVGCTISGTTPNISVAAQPAVVVQPQVAYVAPPPRVYYSGQWLYYRTDGYYYSRSGSWVRASAVPPHVVTYHNRPVHVGAPAPHVVRTTTYVRPASRPVHVNRTVSNRRTYIRR